MLKGGLVNILILDNSFSGAYGSFGLFLREIGLALDAMGHRVAVSRSAQESAHVLETEPVDFSLGIGRYGQFLDGISLYDAFGVHHYQWIVDCPYKMALDDCSAFVKYVFIDAGFSQVAPKLKCTPLTLPLGVPAASPAKDPRASSRGEIVFAGQIRDTSRIVAEIQASKCRTEIMAAIDYCVGNMDSPFLQNYLSATIGMPEKIRADMFGPVNSFVRAYKREYVISHITGRQVSVIGEVSSPGVLSRRNVRLLGKLPYADAFSRIRAYRYALNVEPNFNEGWHDRVLRAPSCGALPVTNRRLDAGEDRCLQDDMVTYDYCSVDEIDDRLDALSAADVEARLDRMKDMIGLRYGWPAVLSRVIDDRKEFADGGKQ
jgi:hypothetical protein